MCQQLGIEIGESTVESSDSNNGESEESETGAKSVALDQNVTKWKRSKKRTSSTVCESSSEEDDGEGVMKRKKRKIMSVNISKKSTLTEGKSENMESDTESKSKEIGKRQKGKVKRNIILSNTSSSSDGHADTTANKPVFIPGKCILFLVRNASSQLKVQAKYIHTWWTITTYQNWFVNFANLV